MYIEVFGISLDFNFENTTLALFFTITIFIFMQMYLNVKKFFPFKDDKLANEALFYVFKIHNDYFRSYVGFLIADREQFSQKLSYVANIYNIKKMQDKTYRIQFQHLLQRHHRLLQEAYILFDSLNHIPLLKRNDVAVVVERTHEILNEIIDDINEEFKDLNKSA